MDPTGVGSQQDVLRILMASPIVETCWGGSNGWVPSKATESRLPSVPPLFSVVEVAELPHCF